MPGLVGFFDMNCTPTEGKARLGRLVTILTHQPNYERDVLFEKEGVYGSRPHKHIIQNAPQPFEHQNLCVWFDGEIYNHENFGLQYKTVSGPELIASLFHKYDNFSFLGEIDGIFSSVIFDAQEKKIYFITDRYGFKFLYYFKEKERLTWFSEAKGVLALETFSPEIDPDSIHDFFDDGYLRGNKSWFKGIELFPPATVVCWDISLKDFSDPYTYWSWNKIQPSKSTTNEAEIVEEMGKLFKAAVQKRSKNSNQICISLSGGLDSRAILASLPTTNRSTQTFTFGKQNCWDIQIAREISEIKGVRHNVVLLNEKNWLDKRIEGVWWTDGQLNLKHMHILNLYHVCSKNFKINLDGFLGDAVQGGYYLKDPDTSFWEKFDNRGRRFINEGSKLGEVFGVYNRRPFMDNDLIEFTLSLPVHLLKQSRLYNKMLLAEFPKFFLSIPWQQTGRPISTLAIKNVFSRKIHALRNRGVKLLNLLGIPYTDYKHFHDYPVWIRNSPDFVEKILHHPQAIYPEFISREQVLKDWADHLHGKDRSEKICACLTFEIFLQQVFEKKFRPEM